MVRRDFLKAIVPVLLVVAGAVPGASVVAAQGEDPSTATAPSTDWTALAIGGRAWYSFDYAGDGSQILVRMGDSPKASATFSVWTPEDLATWARGGGEKPVGRGAANSLYGGDQVWAGSFNTAGTYFVAVDQTGLSAANYRLAISGSGVTFATGTASTATEATATTVASTAEPATVATAAAPETPVATATADGSGPADALAVTGAWTDLAAGRRVWYAFEYDGNSQIQVRMAVSASGAAIFSVWTSDNIRDWVAGKAKNPVGKGTVNSYLGGDLDWSGSFTSAGTYYVVVDSLSSNPSQYNLQVTGGGVHPAATR